MEGNLEQLLMSARFEEAKKRELAACSRATFPPKKSTENLPQGPLRTLLQSRQVPQKLSEAGGASTVEGQVTLLVLAPTHNKRRMRRHK